MVFQKYNYVNNWECGIQFWFDENATIIFLEWNYARLPTSNFIIEVYTKDSTWKVIARENIHVTTRTWNQLLWLTRAFEPVPIDDDQDTNIQQALNFEKTNTIVRNVISKTGINDIQDELERIVDDELPLKANNCNVVTKTTNYTFTWTEENNTWFSTSTAWWDVTYTLDPSLFPTDNGLFEFIFCKSTSDTNKVIIDVWVWKNIDNSQTYELVNYWETVTIKIVSSTFVKVVSNTNKPIQIDIWRDFYFWDWSDGVLTILNGETVTLNDTIYNFDTIDIQAWWKLTRTVTTPLQLKVKTLLKINWTIDLKWKSIITDLYATSQNFNLKLWVWWAWWLWWYVSWYVWWAWWTNANWYIIGAWWAWWGSNNTNYKWWAWWNSGVPWWLWWASPGGDSNWFTWWNSAWWSWWRRNNPSWVWWDTWWNNWGTPGWSASWGWGWAWWGWGWICFINAYEIQGSWSIDCSWVNWWNGWWTWTACWWGWGWGWGGWAIWIIQWVSSFSWTLNVAWWSWWTAWTTSWSYIWAVAWTAWTNWLSKILDYTTLI